ncbi:hypothetical protein GCM10010156_54980 [Planobispora rosea]|uniref:DUF3817 domain-containing protein n=1 Tax=Planobispora rosea TaxID=35762 RepID=A0A8J3WEA2_PLARO|nr:DUF3817 domain-containing protein [Planobispora rosea]GGS89565.1 hypothetical protein GCM10010156_54980 [Planobispora rosea]GIH86764.1 hypothetical protein Pro02_51720 [Planobispora rosea]
MTGVRVLRIAATAEAVSITVLLANLLTIHAKTITSVTGPLHGLAYVTVIATASMAQTTTGARRLALLPGVGGLLALRRLRSRPPTRTDEENTR